MAPRQRSASNGDGGTVVSTKLYDVLEVDSDATDEQIKKAYRKLAMKWCMQPCTRAPASRLHTLTQHGKKNGAQAPGQECRR